MGVLSYDIRIDSQDIDQFGKTEPQKKNSKPGTTVIFNGFSSNFHPSFIEKKLVDKFILKNQRTTKLNKKGDKFYHSLIIRSDFFDNFITPEENEDLDESDDSVKMKLFAERDDYAIYRKLIDILNKYLKKKRRPFLKKYSEVVVAQFERKKVFPVFGNNPWDQLKKDEFVALVKELYEVEPSLFVKLNIEQKKTFLHLLNLIIDADERENLFKILDNVVRLDPQDREELKEMLTSTKLSSIIKATKLIHDRLLTISQIRKVVLDHGGKNKHYFALHH